MKRRRVLKVLMVSVVLLALVALASTVMTSNSKGGKRVIMDWDVLRKDDVAYYLRTWVAQGMGDFSDNNRFMFFEFENLEQAGGQVMVRFKVINTDTKRTFPSVAFFERQPDGTWAHVDETGQIIKVPIYTYNRPPVPPLVKGVGLAGGLVVLAGAAIMVVKRRRRGEQALFTSLGGVGTPFHETRTDKGRQET